MNFLRFAVIIHCLFMGISIALAENSNLMLEAPDGGVCYVDFKNPQDVPPADWVAVYYPGFVGKPPAPPFVQTALLEKGVVKAINHPVETLTPGEVLVALRLNDWLGQHVKVGQRLNLRQEIPFKPNTYTHKINLIDQPLVVQDQMVIYTRKMGHKSPPVIFRRELAVRRDRIVEKGGGDVVIPDNGFVVCGHGESALWLSRWGMVGAKVGFDPKQVSITIDEEAWFRQAHYYLDLIGQRIGKNPVRSDLQERLDFLRHELTAIPIKFAGDPQQRWEKLRAVLARAKDLLYATTASPKTEVRAVFLCGVFAGRELDEIIPRMKSAGINTFVPLLAKPLDPGQKTILNQMARILKANDIKLILWTMLPSQPVTSLATILATHPDWKDRSRTEPLDSLDPANPAAVSWYCDVLKSQFKDLEIAGVLFDYEWFYGGYGDLSRRRFIAQENLPDTFDPQTIPIDSPLFKKWRQWRKNLIINAGSRYVQAIKESRPELQMVGCFTAPSYAAEDDEPLHMIWTDWIKKKTFDSVSAMVYAQDAQWVTQSCRETAKRLNGTPFWPAIILYPETGGSVAIEPELLIAQVEGARRCGASGIMLFLQGQLMPYQGPGGDDLHNCLKTGLFRGELMK